MEDLKHFDSPEKSCYDWGCAADCPISLAYQRTLHVHKEDDSRTFVFGSNVEGYHGGGAAWYAHSKLGAEWGIGEGPTGRTYALPTCYTPGRPLPLTLVAKAVAEFLEYARLNPTETFFVSEVGCGLAGFKAEEVAPFFRDAPTNCDLPPGWRA